MSSSTESASIREHDFRMNKTLILYTEHFSGQASASRKLNDHSRNHGPAASSSDSVQQDELVYRMVAVQAFDNTSTQHVIEEATKLWGTKASSTTPSNAGEDDIERNYSHHRAARGRNKKIWCVRVILILSPIVGLAVGTAAQSGLAAGAFVVAFGTLLHVAGILGEKPSQT